jgi:hypothetical protein
MHGLSYPPMWRGSLALSAIAAIGLLAGPGQARALSPGVNARVFVSIPAGERRSSVPVSGRTLTLSPAVNGQYFISIPLRERPGGGSVRR